MLLCGVCHSSINWTYLAFYNYRHGDDGKNLYAVLSLVHAL